MQKFKKRRTSQTVLKTQPKNNDKGLRKKLSSCFQLSFHIIND